MSVTGEFLRLAGSCIEFLDAAGPAVAPWGNRLHAARALAARDLEAAAERVLTLEAGSKPISKLDFPTASETEEFRGRCEHLLAIARAIVGTPSG